MQRCLGLLGVGEFAELDRAYLHHAAAGHVAACPERIPAARGRGLSLLSEFFRLGSGRVARICGLAVRSSAGEDDPGRGRPRSVPQEDCHEPYRIETLRRADRGRDTLARAPGGSRRHHHRVGQREAAAEAGAQIRDGGPEDHGAPGARPHAGQLRRATALRSHRAHREEAHRRGAGAQHDDRLQFDRQPRNPRTWSTPASCRSRATS